MEEGKRRGRGQKIGESRGSGGRGYCRNSAEPKEKGTGEGKKNVRLSKRSSSVAHHNKKKIRKEGGTRLQSLGAGKWRKEAKGTKAEGLSTHREGRDSSSYREHC